MTVPAGELLGEILALLAAFSGAASAVAFRRAFTNGGVAPEAGVTSYLTMLSAIFLPYVFLTGFPTSPSVLIPFVVGGVIGFVGGAVFYFRSIRLIGAARAVPVRSSAPVFAPVFAAIFLQEELTLAVIVGTITVVLGAVLIVYEIRSGSAVAVERQTLIAGVSSAILSAALFALYPVVLRLGYDAGGTPYQAMAIAGATSLAVVIVLGQFRTAYDPRPLTGPGRRHLLGGAVALVFALTFYLTAFSLAPVVVVIVIYGSLPLFSAILSHLFLSDLETVNVPVVLGSVLVVVGIVLSIGG